MKNKGRKNVEVQIYCFIVRAPFSANENAFIALALRGKELFHLFYTRRINWATRSSRKPLTWAVSSVSHTDPSVCTRPTPACPGLT